MSDTETDEPRIGLALGSGAARGISHIGVIRALARMGVKPHIVCGTSIGALIGGAYAMGKINELEEWLRSLNLLKIVSLMDIKLRGAGFVQGDRLINFFREYAQGQLIEDLSLPYACVATELGTGREVWLREGSLIDAIRASVSLPGLLAPVGRGKRWLVDGGLVNPVPISLCRAMGADLVIAVNLNGDIVGKHIPERTREEQAARLSAETGSENRKAERQENEKEDKKDEKKEDKKDEGEGPKLFSVVMDSINIMQDKITRSRMAGDPADILITPRMSHLSLLEFDKTEEAVREGEASVERERATIEFVLERI